MPVPETAVDENHRTIFRKDDVRLARISAVVLAIPVSFREKVLSDDLFRLRVLSAYMRHVEMPLFPCQNVRHRHHFRASHLFEYLLENELRHDIVKLFRRVLRLDQRSEFDVSLLTVI